MVTLAIVDLSGIFASLWHVIPPTEPASEVHDACVRKVRAIAAGHDHCAIALDTPPYERTKLFADYKAHRSAKPDEIADRDARRVQIERVAETLRADGFAVYGVRGAEADDVIATLVNQVPVGLEGVVYTNDKDLYQLVEPGLTVQPTRLDADGKTPPAVDVDAVTARFGVGPERVGDFLALTGDKVDAVPGVPSIGEVRAKQILTQYGSLDLALAFAERGDPEMPVKMRETLTKHAEQARLSRRLVQLVSDLPISIDDALAPRVPKPLPRRDLPPVPDDEHEENEDMPHVTEGEFEASDPTPVNDPPPPAEEPKAPAPQAAPHEPKAEAPRSVTSTALVQVPAPGTNEWALALEPNTIRQAMWLAERAVDSRVYGNFPTSEAALCAIIQGRELGIPAIASLRLTHALSVQGRTTLAMSAQLIIGLVLKSERASYFKCIERGPTRATWKGHRKGDPDPEPTIVTYTIEDAERAGLIRGGGNWTARPTEMLTKTAGVQLARLLFADIVGGLISPEEMGADVEYREAA